MVHTRYVFVMLLAVAAPAFAQTSNLSELPDRPPRLAAGGGINLGVLPGEEGAGLMPLLQTRIHVGAGMDAELVAHFWDGVEGYYQFRLRGGARSPRVVSGYATLGGLGAFESRHIAERRTTLPTGDVAIYPAHRFNRLTKPFAFTGGGGATIRLPAGLSLDAGGELWWAPSDGVLLTFQTSVMVPLWRGRK